MPDYEKMPQSFKQDTMVGGEDDFVHPVPPPTRQAATHPDARKQLSSSDAVKNVEVDSQQVNRFPDYRAPLSVHDPNPSSAEEIEEDTLKCEALQSDSTAVINDEVEPVINSSSNSNHRTSKARYGGIRRMPYALGVIPLGIFLVIMNRELSSSHAAFFAIFSTVNLALGILRFRNIGSSAWWSLMLLIPYVNLLWILALVILPEGYDDTEKQA